MGNGEQSSTGHIWPGWSWRRHLGCSVTSSSHHQDRAWLVLRARDHLHDSNARFPRFSAARGKPLAWRFSDCSHVFSTELSSAALNRRWTRGFLRGSQPLSFPPRPGGRCVGLHAGVCDVYRGKVSHFWSGVSLQMITYGALMKPLRGPLKVNLVTARRTETLATRPAGRKCQRSEPRKHFHAASVIRFVALLLVSVLKFNSKHI